MMNTQLEHKKAVPLRVAQMQQEKKDYACWYSLPEAWG